MVFMNKFVIKTALLIPLPHHYSMLGVGEHKTLTDTEPSKLRL